LPKLSAATSSRNEPARGWQPTELRGLQGSQHPEPSDTPLRLESVRLVRDPGPRSRLPTMSVGAARLRAVIDAPPLLRGRAGRLGRVAASPGQLGMVSCPGRVWIWRGVVEDGAPRGVERRAVRLGPASAALHRPARRVNDAPARNGHRPYREWRGRRVPVFAYLGEILATRRVARMAPRGDLDHPMRGCATACHADLGLGPITRRSQRSRVRGPQCRAGPAPSRRAVAVR
jgi:hypothetical protein